MLKRNTGIRNLHFCPQIAHTRKQANAKETIVTSECRRGHNGLTSNRKQDCDIESVIRIRRRFASDMSWLIRGA